jgi:outer membrane lipoprotein-sorting protein
MPRIRTALPRQRTALVVAVGLLLASAGCLGTTGRSIEDPDAVAQQVDARHDALSGYDVTVVRTVSTDELTSTTRATVTVENPDYRRVAYHTGPHAGRVSVTNTTAEPVFSPTTGGTSTPATYGALAATLVRGNDLRYLGRTELDGHSTAVVSLVPTNGTETGTTTPNVSERRVWVDTERLVPLRVRTTWETVDGPVTETIRYRNVSLRTGTDTATGGAGQATDDAEVAG